MPVAYILYCLLAVNVFLFLLMGIDKYKAGHHKWRIPEHTLLSLGILCGGTGGLAAMLLFRHKTRKARFYAANIVGIVAGLFILYKLSGNI